MQKMKHICHVTSVHQPTDVRIFLKECRSLAGAGFKVSLVVAGADDREVDGVSIYGVAKSAGRLSRFWHTVNEVMERAVSLKADVYHLHDPELLRDVQKLAKAGAKVTYDAHEDLPKQVMAKTYIPYFLRKPISLLAERMERRVVQKLAGVVTATPIIAERFKKYNPNTTAICNFPSLIDMPVPVLWSDKADEVCYIGGIFKTRGAVEMVNAMTGLDNTRLNLAGSFSPQSLRSELMNLPGWDKVNELGFLNRDGIRSILSRSKVGLVLLHPTDSYKEALPVKLFEYMAAGLPVVASNFPIIKEIVEKHQCGRCVDPLDTSAITTAIRFLIDHPLEAFEMGQRGRKAVEKYYSWQSQEKLLVEFYQNLLS